MHAMHEQAYVNKYSESWLCHECHKYGRLDKLYHLNNYTTHKHIDTHIIKHMCAARKAVGGARPRREPSSTTSGEMNKLHS